MQLDVRGGTRTAFIKAPKTPWVTPPPAVRWKSGSEPKIRCSRRGNKQKKAGWRAGKWQRGRLLPAERFSGATPRADGRSCSHLSPTQGPGPPVKPGKGPGFGTSPPGTLNTITAQRVTTAATEGQARLRTLLLQTLSGTKKPKTPRGCRRQGRGPSVPLLHRKWGGGHLAPTGGLEEGTVGGGKPQRTLIRRPRPTITEGRDPHPPPAHPSAAPGGESQGPLHPQFHATTSMMYTDT